MKMPAKFTIDDLRLTIGQKSPAANRKSASGVALIITLILLSVTLIMAVAFLASARRERNAVSTTTDAAIARLATDAALAAAEAQLAANLFANANFPYNFGQFVSQNYIYLNSPVQSYDVMNISAVLPRPPVYVLTDRKSTRLNSSH